MKQYIGGARENERNFYHPDHLGSGSWITDVSGKPVQHLQYLPYGEPYINQRLSGYNERFTFTGKERDEETGFGYFGARYMDHELMTMWLSVDPMSDKYPSISPYAYCVWNPVKLVDPDGNDWYEVLNEKTGEKEIKWTDYHSQEEMDNNKQSGTYLGERVVLFEGSIDEKLDKDSKLEGSDGKYATVKVYGKNETDYDEFRGFTMSSDYNKYGAIADGYYDVTYDKKGKSGAIPSNYAVESRKPVDCLDNINYAYNNNIPDAYSPTQKDGIFVHRTNNNGYAGGNVSTGCPLIRAKEWAAFEKMIGANGFKMIIRRD